MDFKIAFFDLNNMLGIAWTNKDGSRDAVRIKDIVSCMNEEGYEKLKKVLNKE